MRNFLYYSRTAPTKGNFGDDPMKAGRLDIAMHSMIAAFFLSHKFREDVKLHMIFAGAPDPSKHLELKPVTEGQTDIEKIYLSKKNLLSTIKKMLYKFKEGEKNEVFPGYWIERKGFLELVKDLQAEGKTTYLLDPKGEDIRDIKLDKDPVFIMGDHKGLPDKELKRLKKVCKPITVGPKTYFASQVVTIINNELDRRGV
jgi:tRNA (pseudouridine54-N1)-methyltransferase